MGIDKVGIDEVRIDEVGIDKVGIDEVRIDKVGRYHLRNNDIYYYDLRFCCVG